jgi:2,5-dihydroxypyridine 5,6-dioxygenase
MIRFPLSSAAATDLVALFREGLRQSRVRAGETVLVYSDPLANPHYAAAFLAGAKDLGALPLEIMNPILPADPTALGSDRARPSPAIVSAMKAADLVVDISIGGLLYSESHAEIMAAGTRILRVREPQDSLLRLFPSPEVRRRTLAGAERMRQARSIALSTPGAGALRFARGERPVHIQYGMADEPGRQDHWPTGMVCCAPLEEATEGSLVIAPGSIIFPFGRYVTEPVRLTVAGGRVTAIDGGGDADLLREFLEQSNSAGAFRFAHIGWGTEHRARWHILAVRGAEGGGGAEARSIYGGALVALGENRDLGGANAAPVHVDIALKGAAIALDDEAITDNGRILIEALA